jgi:hypothetical protein
MANEIQTIIATIIGGIVVVVLVMQESPGMLAVARLFVPVAVGRFSFLIAGPDCPGRGNSIPSR